MLSHLIIRNFAIIDVLQLGFEEGFTALTGETGAGKSILVGALGLVLGGRASAEMVRYDAREAVVEAIFELTGSTRAKVEALLEPRGIPSGDQLIIRRIISRTGRNKVFINGSAARVAFLQELTQGLVDIIGQHASYSLLDPVNHVGILDAFGGLVEEAERVSLGVEQLRDLEREVRRLRSSERERLARMDYLTFQLNEIEEVEIDLETDAHLDQELEVLRNAERLRDLASGACYGLYEGEGSVADVLSAIGDGVQRAAAIDPSLDAMLSQLEAARIQLVETARDLRRYAEHVDADPTRLDRLEERIQVLNRLKRKHGGELSDVMTRAGEMRAELEGLERAELRIDEAEAEAAELLRSVMAQARTLSRRRHKAARRLQEVVEEELKDLSMERCRFMTQIRYRDGAGGWVEDVDLAAPESLTPHGIDHVEYLISPNPGMGWGPLAKIASGGELSRIMLALKGALMTSDPVPTYIFDEVDTGIGGRVADVVGRKIREVSQGRQVLCITHLPQVASYADHHVLVEKHQKANGTTSSLRPLDPEQRTMEIARMLGGSTITRKTLEHAEEMIAKSR
ncbi:MAG: DNA repair protein RecN [Myxococcota bacterium]